MHRILSEKETAAIPELQLQAPAFVTHAWWLIFATDRISSIGASAPVEMVAKASLLSTPQ